MDQMLLSKRTFIGILSCLSVALNVWLHIYVSFSLIHNLFDLFETMLQSKEDVYNDIRYMIFNMI